MQQLAGQSPPADRAQPPCPVFLLQGLLQLFADNGVAIPLAKCGPAQYRLGSAKLAVRLVNGRLVARAGAGQTTDVLHWLERQPVQPLR
jgi:hypothetical protein